ncbi:hypothetical protein PF008_g8915 [Phytophthora fragariae]|uniref:RxLR effector protein n=1 Tax=Phytophthora fragariae TaxID=53985 RepID=A0A6G0RZ50_9STRA|nr:hypothetical protein PF008_g8915 [Phytophthora fragariae]
MLGILALCTFLSAPVFALFAVARPPRSYSCPVDRRATLCSACRDRVRLQSVQGSTRSCS